MGKKPHQNESLFGEIPAHEKPVWEREGNVLLKAGAGTGKTYNLTKRVLFLLTVKRCRLDEILCLTFTDLAASEMRERIYKGIAEEIEATSDAILRAHLTREKREFAKNYISTFHAFAQRTLQYFQEELADIEVFRDPGASEGPSARLDAGFETLDEFAEFSLLQEWRKEFYRINKDLPALHNQLSNLRLQTLEGFLDSFADIEPGQLSGFQDMEPADFKSVLLQVETSAKELRDGFYAKVRTLLLANPHWLKEDAVIPSDPTEGLASLFTKAGKLSDRILQKDDDLRKQAGWAVNPWAGKLQKVQGVLDAIPEFQTQDDADIEAYREGLGFDPNMEAYHNLKELSVLAQRWQAFLRYKRVSERKLSFDDLIWFTRRLVSGYPHVAEALKRRFRFVMVDEFQDTDRSQWEIVTRISQTNPGNLFIVGDMKQAIYRFRGGEVSMMRFAESELSKTGQVQVVSLDTSWRSNKAVVETCNSLFTKVFGHGDHHEPFEAEPGNLALSPPETNSPRRGTVTLLEFGEDIDPAHHDLFERYTNQEVEAFRLAALLDAIRKSTAGTEYARITDLMTRGEKAVGILFRSRTHQDAYENALRLFDLSYSVTSGRNFFNRQEILDCYNLLCFLQDGFDNLALAGVLRSPFAGLSDLGLLAIRNTMDAQPGTYSNFWQSVSAWKQWGVDTFIPPDTLALETSLPLLSELRNLAKVLPAGELLERAVYGSNFLFGFADQIRARANMAKLIETVRDLESGGQGSLGEICEFMRLQIERGANESEAILPETGSIQLMTVHSSKGLQFPMVIIPDMNASSGGRGAQLHKTPSDRLEVGESLLFSYASKDRDSFSQGSGPADIIHGFLGLNEQLRNDAEAKRLFYVAATRAETHLVFGDTSSYPSVRRSSGMSFSRMLHEWDSDAADIERMPFSDGELSVIKNALDQRGGTRESAHHEVLQPEVLASTALNTAVASAERISGAPSKTTAFIGDEPSVGIPSQWKHLDASQAGTFIHNLLEMDPFDTLESQKTILANLLLNAGYGQADEALIHDSDLIERHVENGRHVLRSLFEPSEVQVFNELDYEATFDDRFERGVIDLIIKHKNGDYWLLDFKSIPVAGIDQLPSGTKVSFVQQLQAYANAAFTISGKGINIPPERQLIVFTSTGFAASVNELTGLH